MFLGHRGRNDPIHRRGGLDGAVAAPVARAADEVRRRHFSILRQAIAEAGGTEVKNLGDGLMVVFASASAALACAVAMQQGVERDNRRPRALRGPAGGLSGGRGKPGGRRLLRGPGRRSGPALCHLRERTGTGHGRGASDGRSAQSSRVSVARRTHPEGATRPRRDRRSGLGTLGGADTGTSIPLPGRLAVRPAVVWSDAKPRCRAMTDATKRVAGGEGREVLLISGEAGLGKTTLVAEAARAAFDSGACVLFGHCEEDLATPYQLFAEALGHYVTHAPEDQLLAHVEAHGSELSRLVPALASRIPDLPPSKATDSDTERYLLFAAVVGSAGHGVGGPTRRARPRRSPVGRQGKPAAASPPGGGRASHAGAHPRDLPRQRVVAVPRPHARPWACSADTAASPASN